MSIHRYAAKVDANQRQVISALEAAGAKVEVIRQPLDLLIGQHGKWMLMEVKNPRGKNETTKAQERFYARFPGYPWAQVDGPEAALRALRVLGNLQGEA
jgi:hypothetical protein